MFKPKILLLLSLLLVAATWLSSTAVWKKPGDSHAEKTSGRPATGAGFAKTRSMAAEAKVFARRNGYSDLLCFLIDMSLPSGQNRFFIYDFRKDSLQNAGLVTHGRCNQNWLEGRKYGNAVGSGCTSPGKYKIGYSYNGRFGLAFKLYGLDKTNSNAFRRFVVLHSHTCVPETPVEYEICQSDGCPTVAPGFLQQLKPIIERSAKPVLLWIYE